MNQIQRQERQYGSSLSSGDQRQVFQIDRDRIIYSVAFRRLAQVTQVVSVNEGSLFHNRLTHSLKVAQVARRIAENLLNTTDKEIIDELGGLDPDVVEAAALAHDLGHPPFGHIAEEELNALAEEAKLSDGFEGNAQTFRILTKLEPHRFEYPGLNLTRATLNAVLKYPWQKKRDQGDHLSHKQSKKYAVYDNDAQAFCFVRSDQKDKKAECQSLEASIMDFADDITYSVHDLEDFYLAGLIPIDSLSQSDHEFEVFIAEWLQILKNKNLEILINSDEKKKKLRKLINSYQENFTSIEKITKIKRTGSELIQKYIQSASIQKEYGSYGYLKYSEEIELELKFLQRIVWKYVILNPRLATQQMGQRKIIKTLFEIYSEIVQKEKLDLIPSKFKKANKLNILDDNSQRMAIDIVASFSEPEAVTMFRRLTGIEQGSVMDYIA